MSSEDLEQVNMHEAKTHLSRLVERVEGGAEIVINRAGKPAAKLVPIPTGRRKLGAWEGKVRLPSDEETEARMNGLRRLKTLKPLASKGHSQTV